MQFRLVVLFAALAAILVTAGGGYLYSELDSANKVLRATQVSLETTQTHLQETSATLSKTQETLAETTANFDAERLVSNQLQRDKSVLLADKETLTASLNTATDENAMLTTDLATAVELQVELQADLDDIQVQVLTMTTTKADLESRHQQLLLAGGTIEELEAEAQDLRTEVKGLFDQAHDLYNEIRDLEEWRKPLLLARQTATTTGFVCTGSMEPLITCLDEATWLDDFDPADIVVGTTISFPSRACWDDAEVGEETSHMVMDIRVVDGIYEYWPQGYANEIPDGCWIPHTAVRSYLVELHENVVPENAQMRNRVNAAYDAFLDARQHWWDLSISQCGPSPDYDWSSCELPPGQYRSNNYAYNQYQAAYDGWQCELDNAKRHAENPRFLPYLCVTLVLPPPPVQ